MTILTELIEFFDNEEPFPLAWVVKNQSRFSKEWNQSDDPEQLLEIASHVVDRKILVLAAAAVAKTVLEYIPKEEKRPYWAIEAAENWAAGRISLQQASDFGSDAIKASDGFLNKIDVLNKSPRQIRRSRRLRALASASDAAWAAAEAAWTAQYPENAARSAESATKSAVEADADESAFKIKLANIVRHKLGDSVNISAIVGTAKR